MATARRRIIHKHFRLDDIKLKRAKTVLDAATDTEAVDRALDLVISEYQRNKLIAEAHQRFLKSSIHIRDVFGTLAD